MTCSYQAQLSYGTGMYFQNSENNNCERHEVNDFQLQFV